MSDGITLREFVHKIGFAVSLDGLNAYEKSLQRIDEKTNQMFDGANKLIGRLESMGKQLSMKLTLPITALAGVAIEARVKQEEQQTSWGVLLNSMQKGIDFTKQLKKVSYETQFDSGQVDEYAKSLKRLQVPVNQIIPRIKMFADIAAGTGQDAGQMMSEWAEARLNPTTRGAMLTRLMRQGALSDEMLRKHGFNPRMMRRVGATGLISQDRVESIINDLYKQNQGKSGQFADTLGKNIEKLWASLTKVRASIGGMLEKTLHLNGVFKAGAAILERFSEWIDKLSPGTKNIVIGVGALLALLGPGVFIIANFAKAVLFLGNAFKILSLNPLSLQIAAVVAGLVVLLLAARQVNIEIRRMQGKDIESVNKDAFIKSGGKLNQWNDKAKGMVSDAASTRPIFTSASTMSATSYAPRDIFGTGSPVIVHVNNPSVTLPTGTPAEHAAIIQSSHSEIIQKAIKHAVSQVQRAK